MRVPYTRVLELEPTLAVTAGAYTANDVIGGLIKMDIQSAGGWCAINSVEATDDAASISSLTFRFFNAAPTTIADNAAFAPAIADLKKLVGKVTMTSFDTLNGNLWGQAEPITTNKLIDISASNALWMYIVATAAPTFAATTDLFVRVTVLVEGN